MTGDVTDPSFGLDPSPLLSTREITSNDCGVVVVLVDELVLVGELALVDEVELLDVVLAESVAGGDWVDAEVALLPGVAPAGKLALRVACFDEKLEFTTSARAILIWEVRKRHSKKGTWIRIRGKAGPNSVLAESRRYVRFAGNITR
jgi:hypothetical protein